MVHKIWAELRAKRKADRERWKTLTHEQKDAEWKRNHELLQSITQQGLSEMTSNIYVYSAPDRKDLKGGWIGYVRCRQCGKTFRFKEWGPTRTRMMKLMIKHVENTHDKSMTYAFMGIDRYPEEHMEQTIHGPKVKCPACGKRIWWSKGTHNELPVKWCPECRAEFPRHEGYNWW